MERVLEALRTATCPFVTIASQRAGVSKGTVDGWINKGRLHLAEGEDSPAAEFTEEVARIQGEWKDRAMGEIMAANKETAQGAANMRWLLERLDREIFDISRPALNAKKGHTEKPQVPSPEKMKELEEDLARPEPLQ